MTPEIKILRTRISQVTFDDMIDAVNSFLNSPDQHYIVTPNPEFVLKAEEDEEFNIILNQADIAIPDGTGLLWAAYFLHKPLPKNIVAKYIVVLGQIIKTGLALMFNTKGLYSVLPKRVQGAVLVEKLLEETAGRGVKWFFLGAAPGVGEKAAAKMREKYEGVDISTFAGDRSEAGDAETVAAINQAQPDILIVGYGFGYQERWIGRNLSELPSVKVAMGVGTTIDLLAGNIKQAPASWRQGGWEWLWRIFHDTGAKKLHPTKRPGRVWRAFPVFIWRIIKYKVTDR